MYTYTFINGTSRVEVDACNMLTACDKLKIRPTRVDKLSNFYLQSTPFNERVHTIWEGNKMYKIEQRKN